MVQSREALHANLLKIVLPTGIFQRISPQVQNSNIEKGILMAASENNFILKIFLNGCFSWTAAKILILEILITHIIVTRKTCYFQEITCYFL